MKIPSNKNHITRSEKVAGILVTYFPDSKFFENIHQYIHETDIWCIVDNGSGSPTCDELNKIKNKYPNNIKLIINEENLGLATAQNQACSWAEENEYSYLYFLDQDSIPSSGSVDSLISFFKSNNQDNRIGLVGSHIKHESGKIQKYWIKSSWFYKRIAIAGYKKYLSNVNTIISSGSFLPIYVWKEAGKFMDSYFIDYIDIEYCLRLRKFGYSIFVLKQATIAHQLGGTRKMEGVRGRLHSTFHSPFRRYMMARNRVNTWGRYMVHFPGWFLVDLGNFIFDVFRILVVEKNRWENLKAIGRGLIDGLSGKNFQTIKNHF